MAICKLCKQNEATQTNSHIIPKFFAKTLRIDEQGKIGVYKLPSKKKSGQDIEKEDFLFCPECEKNFSKLETAFSKYVYHPVNKILANQPRELLLVNGSQYIVLNNQHYLNYKLLIYSIVFRCHVSSKETVHNLNLSESFAEDLRKILNREIDFVDIPTITISTTDQNKKANLIMATSRPYNRDECLLFLNDFIILFNNVTLPPEVIEIHKKVIIEVLKPELWKKFRSNILDMVKRSHNI